jgi:hypothetical protein
VLRNGVVGYFVEDHDLPLINLSVTVRAGTYLDPAGKEGLAAATASQMRAGGTAHYKAEEFDEEADFLAASLSSSMSRTAGSVSANFMSKDTDKALELFFEMLRYPAFSRTGWICTKASNCRAWSGAMTARKISRRGNGIGCCGETRISRAFTARRTPLRLLLGQT